MSNNGKNKFVVDPRKGEVEVVAPVKEGEQFSLTVRATDKGNLSSEAIMQVRKGRINYESN